MPDLPMGTVTLLFTDIEGSTRPLQQLGDGYATVLAQGAGPYLTRAEQILWLKRLEREYENLRAALQWSAAHGDEEMELALRLSSGLLAFWTLAQASEN